MDNQEILLTEAKKIKQQLVIAINTHELTDELIVKAFSDVKLIDHSVFFLAQIFKELNID